MPWQDIQGDAILARRYTECAVKQAHWTLGEIVDIASGLYVSEYVHADTQGAKPYLRVDNVRTALPNLTAVDMENVRADVVPGYARVSVQVGDVVIARTATLGRAFVVDGSLDGAVMSQHVTRLRLRNDHSGRISPHVLAAFLNTPAGKEAVLSRASGSTRLELTHHDLATVEIPQALCKVVLDTGYAVRVAKLFEEMRESVTSARALCGELAGLPPEGETGWRSCFTSFEENSFETSMLPRFHSPAWGKVLNRMCSRFRMARLGDLAKIQRGAGTSSKEYLESGIPYLRTSSLVNEGIDLFPEHYGCEATYEEHAQHVGTGDILLTIEGKIGCVAQLGGGERALIKNHIEVIRLQPWAPPSGFVTAWLGAWPAQLQLERFTVVQTTIPGIASASRDLLVPVAGHTDADDSYLTKIIAVADELITQSVAARSALAVELARLREAVSAATSQCVTGRPK